MLVRERRDFTDRARGKAVVEERHDVRLCKGKWFVRERRDVSESARGKVVGGESRDVTDSAIGKGVVRERRDVTESEGGMWSLGRDVFLQTVEEERSLSGET